LYFITLSNYSLNTYDENVFYKKYEFFADIFSTSYGFGKSLQKTQFKLEKYSDTEINTKMNSALYKIPIYGALCKYEFYKYMRMNYNSDIHGTNDQRIRAIYTSLVNELKINNSLSIQQKKEIINQINTIKENDELHYTEMKHNGFFYRLYNKMIDKRIKNEINPDVVTDILDLMNSVCIDEIKKKK
jgi:hypothetical protein